MIITKKLFEQIFNEAWHGPRIFNDVPDVAYPSYIKTEDLEEEIRSLKWRIEDCIKNKDFYLNDIGVSIEKYESVLNRYKKELPEKEKELEDVKAENKRIRLEWMKKYDIEEDDLNGKWRERDGVDYPEPDVDEDAYNDARYGLYGKDRF